MKKTVLGIVAATSLVLAGTAMAVGPGGMKGERGHKHAQMQEFVFEYVLNLTQDQKAQVSLIKAEAKTKLDQLKGAGVNRNALRELSPDDADYTAKIASLAKQKGEQLEQMIIIRSAVKAQIHQLLTEEQQQAMMEFKAKKKASHEERMQARKAMKKSMVQG